MIKEKEMKMEQLNEEKAKKNRAKNRSNENTEQHKNELFDRKMKQYDKSMDNLIRKRFF